MPSPRSKIAQLLAATLGVVLLAAACSSDPAAGPPEPAAPTTSEATGGAGGGTLTYGLEAESTGWNPSNTIWDSSGLEVARALFDTLTAYDSSGHWQPNLAESVTPAADHTRWTITVRTGVTLHNGRPADAQVVASDLEVMRKAPLTAGALEPVESIVVTGPLSVEVTLRQPWVDFPDMLTGQLGMVTDPDWLASGDGAQPVGTGPFRFSSWTPDQQLVVDRNPSYWRKAPDGTQYPLLDEVVFRPLPDPAVREANLHAGRIDIMQTSTPWQIDDLTSSGGSSASADYQVFTAADGPAPERFVMLNTAAAPFQSLDARRAVAMATDHGAYAERITSGLAEVANGPFQSADTGGTGTSSYPDHDTGAAQALAAGLTGPNGPGLSFDLLATSAEAALAEAQLLQAQWAAAGIQARLVVLTPSELADRVRSGDYQAVVWQQFDAPDPLVDATSWLPAAAAAAGSPALNLARLVDPALATAVDRARASLDEGEREQLVGTIEQRLNADIAFVWLVRVQRAVVADADLADVVNYVLPDGEPGLQLQSGTQPLWQVWRRS